MKAKLAEEANDDKAVDNRDMEEDEDDGSDSDVMSVPSDCSRDGTSNIDDRLVPPVESMV